MATSPVKQAVVTRSIAEEVKKVAYVGAAGPYVLMGEQAKTIVGGSTLVAISLVWFIMCQVVAHIFMVLADKMEANDD